jgi:hypothetical protein
VRHPFFSTAIACAALVQAAGCGPGKRPQVADAGNPCEVRIGDATYFRGEASCFDKLPMHEIAGFFVLAHEYSVFYEDRESIPLGIDPHAAWLTLSRDADASLPPFDGELHTYEVRFIGTISHKLGVYGPGPFPAGVYVKRLVSFKEIRSP